MLYLIYTIFCEIQSDFYVLLKISTNVTNNIHAYIKSCYYSQLIKNFYFKAKYKKASKLYPEISSQTDEQMQNQNAVEESKSTSVDLAADASAKALGNIIAFRFTNEEKENAYRFGYCLGRFVYICDALDDLEKDFKNKNYNVFLLNNKSDFDSIRQNSYSILDITADEMAKAYESLQLKRYKSILDNIIYYGLDSAINKVLKKEK